MIGHIARKELAELVRDGRFRWAAAIVAGLLLVSAGAGWTRYRDVSAQHAAAAAATRAHWLGQGEKNPHSAAHYGIYAFKPRLPLSFLDQGVDEFAGTTVWLEAHRQNDFMMRPAQDATAAQRFGNATAAGVLQLLVPLLVVLLAFGAFAGEREQGTLRQTLALGVSRTQVAWGKALGIAGALALLLVPAALLGAAALLLGSAGAVAPTFGRGAVLVAVYLAYFGVFLAVSLAVSARASSSRLALLVLLGFWAVNGLIAPRVAVDLSKRLDPAPTAFEFARAIQAELSEPMDVARLEREVLDQYGVETLDALPVNFAGIRLQASEEHGDVVFDRHYGALWDAFGRQSRTHEAIGALSPLLAVRALSMGLAGTDVEQHRHFAAAAEAYRRSLVKAMNDDLAFSSVGVAAYAAGPELWESVPAFTYEAPRLASVLGSRTMSLIVLGLWVLGSLLVAAGAVRRAPVD
ncbi:MAG: DUF3526 domain-containing protein [Gemmatimonadetes bacterium]|nr:DUF3526 domain-containing protein [Gemmatimonadota bacterium]